LKVGDGILFEFAGEESFTLKRAAAIPAEMFRLFGA